MKKSKLLIFLVIVLAITSIFIGCTNNQNENLKSDMNNNVKNTDSVSYPMEVIDGLNNTVTIDKKPERIISIAPNQTEILFALGLGDKVVGVSDFCDYPLDALEKEKVGNAFAINVEKILELDPDIVLIYGEGQPEAVEQLKANGITILKHSPETSDEVFNTILQLGKVADVEEKAEQVVGEMKYKRDDIINKVKGKEKVRVFYQIWDEPLMTAGPGSFIDELITLAGGENIVTDGEGPYPQYSAEAMVEKDPEVYIAPAHSAEVYNLSPQEIEELKNIIKSRPGYESISAVKNNRVELLEPNIVSRPGIRIIEALELFAKAIHPEVF